MGRIHHRSVRYVDAGVKNDYKLIKCVKSRPIIYDKSHSSHRNFTERQKTWQQISECVHKTSTLAEICEKRWYQLVRKYKECKQVLVLHDVLFEELEDFLEKLPNVDHCVPEMEDDVLTQLFSEGNGATCFTASPPPHAADPVDLILADQYDTSTPEISRTTSHDVLGEPPPPETENYIFDAYYSDLMDEAGSLPPSESSRECFEYSSLSANNASEEDVESYRLPIEDIRYRNDEDVDDYYNYFTENILLELNKYPHMFGDIVVSLTDSMDCATRTQVRKETVKMLCERLKKYRIETRR